MGLNFATSSMVIYWKGSVKEIKKYMMMMMMMIIIKIK
jgi:hypothetical protein